jgi:hypothetical protein
LSNPSLNFLQKLTKLSDVRTARSSSWDQSGRNKDYWLLAPGQSVVLTDIEGPGCINHLWMTTFCRKVLGPSILDPELGSSVAPVAEMFNAIGVQWELNDPFYYRKVLLKMTWDDHDFPSVLVPLGDFFGIGHSMPGNYASVPFFVSTRPEEQYKFGGTAAMNCYFPMPFNKRAVIEIINENELPVGLYFHIDYELYRQSLGENVAYFHAQWRRELPCDGWAPDLQANTPEVNSVPNLYGEGNYTILETRGQGHYVGCNLSVTHFQGSWWGEGDDMIFIDGEKMPSINGTGSEDYFNHAWGMQRVSSLYNGTIIHEFDAPGYQVSYRFHITDPIHFAKEIRVTMEHGHANHLADEWASTAFYYQTLTREQLTVLPVEQRLPIVRPELSVEKPEVPLNAEMKQAFEKKSQREKEFLIRKNEMIQQNISRTAASSQGNVEQGKKVRGSFK